MTPTWPPAGQPPSASTSSPATTKNSPCSKNLGPTFELAHSGGKIVYTNRPITPARNSIAPLNPVRTRGSAGVSPAFFLIAPMPIMLLTELNNVVHCLVQKFVLFRNSLKHLKKLIAS